MGTHEQLDEANLRDLIGPTIHYYPRDLKYRKSGMTPPQPGDMARCGWIKQNPHAPEFSDKPATCLLCIRLYEASR